jgi:hypothetical protein
MPRKISQCFKIIVILLSLSVSTRSAAADPDIERIQRDLITSWIVDVDGETRTRTLNIRGAEKRQDGFWVLDATYGWTDGGQSAVNAELIVKSDGYRLKLTTQADSQISAENSGVGPFTGTFRWKSGAESPVKLVRASDADRMSAQSLAIVQPAPDVPASCASFVGGWTGNWDFGQRWLWIVEVDRNCIAKYSYPPQVPRSVKTTEIKQGVLSFSCGTHGGTCFFQEHGGEIWGRYGGTDGFNTAVFKRIPSANEVKK